MTQEELDEILLLHKKFLNNEEGGQRADLSYQDLFGLNLTQTTLDEANCAGTNFFGVDVAGVSFQGADLAGACFKDCSLRRCNFLGANLHKSDLRNTFMYLTRFDLADLSEADLSSSFVAETTAGHAVLDFINDAQSDFLTVINPDEVFETEPRDLLE